MDLERAVLPRAECTADTGEGQADHFGWTAEAGRDLGPVDVEELRRHEQFDPAVVGRDRQSGFGAHRRLVLHTDLVGPLDGHVPVDRRVAVADDEVANHVAVGVDGIGDEGDVGIDDRVERLVVHHDRLGRPSGDLGMVGRDDRDRFAQVANLAVGQHGLVGGLETEHRTAGHVIGGEHGMDARHGECGAGFDRADPGPGVGGAEGARPTASRRRPGRMRRRSGP